VRKTKKKPKKVKKVKESVYYWKTPYGNAIILENVVPQIKKTDKP
jgi:hypothetical protein